MSDRFELSGNCASGPISGTPSGSAAIQIPLEEVVVLDRKHTDTISLLSDSPAAVPFGAVVDANVIVLHASGGKVSALLTSADGSAQAVPVDPLLICISKTVPITAISLVRVTSTPTDVEVFIGQGT